jgi:tetratricopeptide (TPR) repeat protein
MKNVLRLRVLRIAVACACTAALCSLGSVGQAQNHQPVILIHHPVTTKSAAAQREFDAGLTLMYAFNPEEAAYRFERAAEIDPQLAMAYYGMALATGPNINTTYELARARVGREAIAQARRLEPHASARERDYIEALAPRYEGVTTDERIAGAQRAYAVAMRTLARRYPNDLDATTLYAESLMDLTPLHMWNGDGTPAQHTPEVLALLNRVVGRNPDHIGANHLLIHAWEDSRTPQAALPAARHLMAADLPPGAEHLAHMPAHVFTRVGDYDDAIAAGLRAIALFRRYLTLERSTVHNAYYHHNFQVLNYAYMMSGQWANAHAAAIQIADQVGDNAAGVETYLRFHKWRELLGLTPPARPDVRWRFAHAMASAATGDQAEARSTLDAFGHAPGDDPRTGIARESLAAQIDIAQNRNASAIAHLRRAVAFQDRLPSREPPAWFYPIRETLGARLVIAGAYSEAARVFSADLQRNPNNPRSLFGLSQALEKAAPARAAAAAASFRRAWSHADVQLGLTDL